MVERLIQDSHPDLPSMTAIATITLYNPNKEVDRIRIEIAKNSIQLATNLGYDVHIVDGGSPDEFLEYISSKGAHVYKQQGSSAGLVTRKAIQSAYDSGREYIAWTELEKESYIPKLYKTVEQILSKQVDLVVPRRKSMQSYPEFQQYSDKFGNVFWRAATGTDLDVFFGPKTWRRDMSKYFLEYDGKYGNLWDATFVPLIYMLHDGKRITSVEVDFDYPKKQREIEERDHNMYLKRLRQLVLLSTTIKEECLESKVSGSDPQKLDIRITDSAPVDKKIESVDGRFTWKNIEQPAAF